MAFDSFQNDSATLQRNSKDFSGSYVVDLSIAVVCDVQFKRTRTTNTNGELIVTNAEVYLTPTGQLNAVSVQDLTEKKWTFLYGNVTYQVEKIDRVRRPAADIIDHYMILLR